MFVSALICYGQSWANEPPPPMTNTTLEKLQDLGHRAVEFSGRASELAMKAMGMIGIHYKYGGTTPESGLDCSGLVRYVFKEAWGANLPRTSAEISRVGETIEPQNLQPGDLVFYNTLKRGFSHVGIYLDEGLFVHSGSRTGVAIASLNDEFYTKTFLFAKRMF